MNRSTLRVWTSSVFALLVALSVACGGQSPSAPTTIPDASTSAPATPAPAPATTGATIAGVVSSATTAQGFHPLAIAAGVTVTVAGTSASAAVDAAGAFTIAGVPAIEVVLTFAGPGVDASLPLGPVSANERVEITVTIQGATATLEAQHRTEPNNQTQTEGKIEELDAAARRLLVSGTTVFVNRDAVIRRGDAAIAFEDLRRGDRVQTKGVKSGSTINVSQVVVRTETRKDPVPEAVTYSATIAQLDGRCPAIHISIGSKTAETSASTTFAPKPCADLRRGDAATVTGMRTGDGPIVATKVEVALPPASTISYTGAIEAMSGACPSLSFKFGSKYAQTSSSTIFSPKACGDLKIGTTVTATGTRTGDGPIVATKVEAKLACIGSC